MSRFKRTRGGAGRAPEFSLDPDRSPREVTCPKCGRKHPEVTGFVFADGDRYAIYKAHFYDHDEREVYFDAILGSFDDEESYADHITFGCRYGWVEGHPEPTCSLVTPTNYSDSPIWGKRLTRDEALADARIQDFWDLFDWAFLNDPFIRDFSV